VPAVGRVGEPPGLPVGGRSWSCGSDMTEQSRGPTPRRPIAAGDDGRPAKHPTGQAAVLLVVVTILIVVLAVVSSYGWI
jgi:hypothetical protein